MKIRKLAMDAVSADQPVVQINSRVLLDLVVSESDGWKTFDENNLNLNVLIWMRHAGVADSAIRPIVEQIRAIAECKMAPDFQTVFAKCNILLYEMDRDLARNK